MRLHLLHAIVVACAAGTASASPVAISETRSSSPLDYCAACHYVVHHIRMLHAMPEADIDGGRQRQEDCTQFERDPMLKEKCLEYMTAAILYQPTADSDIRVFCNRLGACLDDDDDNAHVEVTTTTTNLIARVDNRLHHITHRGVVVEAAVHHAETESADVLSSTEKPLTIVDQALRIESGTYVRGAPRPTPTLWQRLLAWMFSDRHAADTPSRTWQQDIDDSATDARAVDEALAIFEAYQAALDQQLANEHAPLASSSEASIASTTATSWEADVSGELIFTVEPDGYSHTPNGFNLKQLRQAIRTALKLTMIVALALIPVAVWFILFGKDDERDDNEADAEATTASEKRGMGRDMAERVPLLGPSPL